MAAGGFPFGRIFRSSAVRQALALILVFAVVEAATLGGAYVKMRADVVATIRSDLEREVAGFDLSATPGALRAIVGAKARATDPKDLAIVFLTPDGRQTGNARAMVEGDAIRLTRRPDAAPLAAAGYAHEIRRLSGGVLIVAASLARADALRQTFVGLMAFSLAPTVLISLALAAFIARRTARRASRIEGALERLSAGDLAARVDPAPAGDDDLARIAAGVNRMAARQEAATEALRQVSADIAHDLKTPLQRVSILLHDLRGRIGDDEAGQLADAATEEAERAVAVFQSLLQIAQIEGKGAAADFRTVDLRDPARRIFELYAPSFEDRGDRFDCVLPEAPVEADGDAGLISQALVNLVENALRHTPAGGRVAIEVAQAADGARLTVADNGPGVPAEERENVVRRLYRLERSRTTPGAGLGLSLVAAVAELHGGRLTLEDNGPGLRASLHFPAQGEMRRPNGLKAAPEAR